MPGATPIAGKLKAIPCPRHIRSLHTQHDGLSTPGPDLDRRIEIGREMDVMAPHRRQTLSLRIAGRKRSTVP
jgi:hypothetical protein